MAAPRLPMCQVRSGDVCGDGRVGVCGVGDGGAEGRHVAAMFKALPQLLAEERLCSNNKTHALKYALLNGLR